MDRAAAMSAEEGDRLLDSLAAAAPMLDAGAAGIVFGERRPLPMLKHSQVVAQQVMIAGVDLWILIVDAEELDDAV